MAETTRHDAWNAGDSYEAYMGRWSRRIAPVFLDWIEAAENLDWLDVGCGTGALTGARLAHRNPKSIVSIDPSDGFLATARALVTDDRVDFRVGDAQRLQLENASRNIVVSALILNLWPDRLRALTEMRRAAKPGGTVAFYVWDYPGGGVEFMRAFWDAATSLDPTALDLTEGRRFPFCTEPGLTNLMREAGLAEIRSRSIEVPTVFRDFDDYWRPFTLGAGPAPGYCASLAPEARQRLKELLEKQLPRGDNGTIPLKTRAWALKGAV